MSRIITSTEFVLTPDDFLDLLLLCLPALLTLMRVNRCGWIKIKQGSYTSTCELVLNPSDEPFFRLDDKAIIHCYPINNDSIILELALRIEQLFESIKRFNKGVCPDSLVKIPLELEMDLIFTTL
jgi:hypothetical protein